MKNRFFDNVSNSGEGYIELTVPAPILQHRQFNIFQTFRTGKIARLQDTRKVTSSSWRAKRLAIAPSKLARVKLPTIALVKPKAVRRARLPPAILVC